MRGWEEEGKAAFAPSPRALTLSVGAVWSVSGCWAYASQSPSASGAPDTLFSL